MFKRHPDIVNIMLQDAPGLVVPLLDGLIWRSRLTDNGMRRVNYYMKHLMIDPEGKFAKNLDWIVKSKDPKLMVHPCLVLLADIVWTRVLVTCRSRVICKKVASRSGTIGAQSEN